MPPGCDISYACIEVSGGPSPFVTCDIPDVTTFDGRKWTFKTDQIRTYTPGNYSVTIEGTTGINSFKSTNATFQLTLEDPCPFITVSLTDNPFSDVTYYLQEDEDLQEYHLLDMVEINTLLDCGKYQIAFYNNDKFLSALDSDLFLARPSPDFVGDTEAGEFVVNFIDTYEAVGSYPISFTVFLEEYPDKNVEVLDAFVIDIVNPCEDDSVFNKPFWCPEDFADAEI